MLGLCLFAFQRCLVILYQMKTFTLKLLAHKIFTLIRTITLSSRIFRSPSSSRWAHKNTCERAALSRLLTLFVFCSRSLRMCVIVCVCVCCVYIHKWMVKFRFCVLWRYRCRHWLIWRKYSRIFTHTLIQPSIACSCYPFHIHTYVCRLLSQNRFLLPHW